jgi:hypothetical protein
MSADWLELGPPRRPANPRRSRAVLAALVVAALVVTVLAVRSHGRSQPDAAPDPPTPSASAQESASSYTPPHLPPKVPQEPPAFLDRSLALPGASNGDVLFALSKTSIFRIDLDTGRVRRIGGTTVGDNGVISLIAGPDRVLVSTAETGSGTVIEDGRPGRPLPRLLLQRSQLYPGPPGLLWAQSRTEEGPGTITLVDFDGEPQQPPILLGGGWPQPDSRGNVLVSDVGGVFETDGSRLRRVTTGVVAGVGENHYLLVECNRKHRCTRTLLERDSGKRHRLAEVDTASIATGILSPDGRYAALVQWRGAEPPQLRVDDLKAQSSHPVRGAVEQQYGPDSSSNLAFTADGRWLIMLLDGRITVMDTRTGKTRSTANRLPALLELALRPWRPVR